MGRHARILRMQRAEHTEHHIYRRLAALSSDPRNREILETVARDEYRHYEVWRSITGRDVAPQGWKIRLYVALARIFGLSFALKLMEGGEDRAQAFYREVVTQYPQVTAIGEDEKRHEKALVTLLKDERLSYAGAIVLGLNDALVELTGTLAGLTLAFANSSLIAVTGLIMGIAASLSMASSGYLSAQEEDGGETEPLKSAVYTGAAYLVTVLVLVSPYFIADSVFVALGVMLALSVLIIAAYTFYIAVAKEVAFAPRFGKMAAISVGVAVISFGIGWLLKTVIGVDV
ncbi:MAG: VIT1/CCC1 transporter family protein [Thiohalomonadaceae bacterium]